MKLTIFYADKGDSLLLTSKDGRSILCDGGTPLGYRESIRPALEKALPTKGELDVVYVSHIDEDHIGGILGLFDDALDWRVYHHHQKNGDATFKAPAVPEPPAIAHLWQNAFHELLKDNKGAIRDLLAANALALRLVDAPWARFAGARSATIVNSIPQAIRLARRAGPDQLGIAKNAPAKGKLMTVETGRTKVGKLQITPIGPADEDLENLRDAWNEWLRDNRPALAKLRKAAKADEDQLRNAFPAADAALLGVALATIGDRTKVTPPNLASLMLHVEEGGKTLLLTGDGHSDDVERGLEKTKLLKKKAGLHVDVLKVPHHGSEHNTRPAFPPRVTADHYVFCGNGFARNPDEAVVRAYLDSRLGSGSKRSTNPEAKRPFHFWFSAHSKIVPPTYKPHMRKIEKLASDAAAASGGTMKVTFLKDDPLVIEL